MDEVKKLTIKDIRRMYEEKEPMSWISIYDYPMAYYADQAGIDVIFVGDSSTTTVLGYPNTLYASMDQMIMFAGAVTRAVKHAFVIGDLPYRSYQASVEDAVRNAMRYMAEGHVDAVKCEGGEEVCDRIAEIVKWGMPCHGHIGVTPQSLAAQGGYIGHGGKAGDGRHRSGAGGLLCHRAGVCAPADHKGNSGAYPHPGHLHRWRPGGRTTADRAGLAGDVPGP